MKWTVLYDEAFDPPQGLGEPIPVPRVGELAPTRWGDELDVPTVVVAGDDWTVSRVTTLMYELNRESSRHPTIVLLRRGDDDTVADAVGTRGRDRRPRQLVRMLKRGAFDTARLPAIRVVDSAFPHALIGFNFGMGLMYEIFEARARASVGGRLGTLEALGRTAMDSLRGERDPVDATVAIGWERRADRFGQLLASGLRQTWFDIRMNKRGPSVLLGDRPAQLLEGRSRLGRLAQIARGDAAEKFSRIHIDSDSGYVLDGELFDPGLSRSILVEPGPSVQFAVI